jgi:uncharacterized BrkB/YihY/UPF0761 family membrane protein
MTQPGKSISDRTTALTDKVGRHRTRLEQHRFLRFPLSTYRRFKEIEGTHLALVIAANAFIAIIPLLIVGYAFIEAFSPDRTIGNVLVGRFHLTGATADTVRATFSTAKAGKTVALSIGLISLLITGLDIAGTVGTAYARSFRVTPLAGWRRYLRGWIWLITLLVMTSIGLTIRYWASTRPWWFLVVLAPVALAMTFIFYLVTPRVVLDLCFDWRDLLPGAAICTVLAAALNTASTLILAHWFAWYGGAYGAFGVALALMSWVGVLALFWVWIAAAQGVYWERRGDHQPVPVTTPAFGPRDAKPETVEDLVEPDSTLNSPSEW